MAGLEPRPWSRGASIAGVDAPVTSSSKCLERSSVVGSVRACRQADGDLGHVLEDRFRREELFVPLVGVEVTPGTMVHAVVADRHPSVPKLSNAVGGEGTGTPDAAGDDEERGVQLSFYERWE